MEEGGVFVISAVVGILLLFAAFGNSRPLWVLGWSAAFLAGWWGFLAICLSSAGSIHVGAAGILELIFYIPPVIAFIALLAYSIISTRPAVQFSLKFRAALTLASIAIVTVALVSENNKKIAPMKVEEAIANNSPDALAWWRNINQDRPGQDEYALILKRHGLSEDSLKLLRALGSLDSNIWPLVLAFPASPERLDFLRQIAALEPGSVNPDFFIQAMDAGDTETADLLYPFMDDPDINMVKAQRLDLLRDVIRRGLRESPEPYRSQALLGAAALEPEYTRILLEAGFDPNLGGEASETPLMRALIDTGRNRGVARLLLEAGADPDPKQDRISYSLRTPLHYAAAWGTEEGLDMLLSAGANPNARNYRDGATPLHYAVILGNNYAVKRLLEHGAEVKAQDEFGMTPLHWAAWRGDPESCAPLLAAGAPVDEANEYDKLTPLFHAASLGGAPTLNALLENASPELKSLLNKADDYGKTPWDRAVRGEVESVTESAERAAMVGISIDSLDLDKPEEWQRSLKRRAECVRLLLAAGADPMRPWPEVPGYKGSTIFHALFDWRLGRDYFYQVTNDNRDRRYQDYGFSDFEEERLSEVYPQSLRALLQAGVPLPALKDGQTYEKYCYGVAEAMEDRRGDARHTMKTAACASTLTEEKARREAGPKN